MIDRYSGFFEPDVLVPSQHASHQRRRLRPVERLMLAVLQDGLDCFQKYACASDAVGRQLFREADAWISDEDSDREFSFESICETLNLKPEALRKGVQQWRRQKLLRQQPVRDTTVPQSPLL